MRSQLTEHLKMVLVALVEHKRQHDEMPTIKELTERLGFKSQTATVQAMWRLEESGHIERIPNRARGIKITTKGKRHGKN